MYNRRSVIRTISDLPLSVVWIACAWVGLALAVRAVATVCRFEIITRHRNLDYKAVAVLRYARICIQGICGACRCLANSGNLGAGDDRNAGAQEDRQHLHFAEDFQD
jgi:hypothetical protein